MSEFWHKMSCCVVAKPPPLHVETSSTAWCQGLMWITGKELPSPDPLHSHINRQTSALDVLPFAFIPSRTILPST
ncbi:hypothetical protein JZ751_009857 [Albula glossodonta]|uniref:Uncharacterized protein n=1 Tax=Albula glossodonta TaxID=121402 RepID=A0A8T2P1S8_9TELE|nr:hypothetical protein JZ751_009857 [Albula glossodonta]